MDDYITVKRQFVLDAINIGLSGYISDDDKLTLEGMGIAVSEMPTTDLSGYSDRLWKSAYDRGYERCRQDAINVAKQHWYKPDIANALEELPSAQPDLSDDGTLMMTVPHGILSDVKRVMVDEVGTKFCKVMYQDEPERGCDECVFKPFKQFQPERR